MAVTEGATPGKGPGPAMGPGAAQGMPAREPASDPARGGAAWAGGARGAARLALTGLVVAGLLWTAFRLALSGEPLFAAALLALAVGVAVVYGLDRFYALRFVFPATVAVLAFIALPVGYTSYLGFTNYSSTNLLTEERARAVLLSRATVDPATERPFGLVAEEGGAFRVFLPAQGEAPALLSEPFEMGGPVEVAAEPFEGAEPATMELRDVVRLRDDLGLVTLTDPEGTALVSSGLRSFASVEPLYEEREDGALVASADGSVLTPDPAIGFFRDEAGNPIAPGWRVGVGLANFERVLTSAGVREPMVRIFVWTVAFALISTFLVFALGVLLASILQWPHLKGRAVYRLLLILPYAVPAFISILVFRGLFNQNFGEINFILDAALGVRPPWFTDGAWARTMTIIVNVWLGYPYMMLLAMGFLQSVPQDQLKAAALEGAGALRVFFTITLPQILPPFLPMLIATFAFNFNNLVLILLLTQGLPDIPGTTIPAGQTDILGSFTYRISFLDAGQDFGLAGAIATLIFLVVGLIAYANFKALQRAARKP